MWNKVMSSLEKKIKKIKKQLLENMSICLAKKQKGHA